MAESMFAEIKRLGDEHARYRAALEKLLRAEEKYVRDTGLPQPDDLIQTAVNEARQLLGWPALGVAIPLEGSDAG